MIRVVYFASLREALGREGEVLDSHPATLAELRTELAARGGIWADRFAPGRRVLAAVNQDLVEAGHCLANGDEVGFFPPVTGG